MLSELGPGIDPVVVQPEVGLVLVEVGLVAGEDRCQQLEDVQGQPAGVDLLEDGRDGAFARPPVQLDGGDLVALGGCEHGRMELPEEIVIFQCEEPRHGFGRLADEPEGEEPLLPLLVRRRDVQLDVLAEVAPYEPVAWQ